MKSRILTALLALLLLVACTLLFAACGGGGDEPGGDEGGTTYTVYCFKSEGAAAEEIKISAEKGNAIAPASKAHYKFLGYYTAEGTQIFNASGKQVEGLLIDKSITVYARFEPISYTVTFVVGEGTMPQGAATSVTLNADAWQMVAPVPTAPLQTLQFEGWYNKDFTVQYVGEHGTVDYSKFNLGEDLAISNGEIKLYAKYDTRTVKVTIDYNDFTTNPKQIEVVYGSVLGDLTDHKIADRENKKEIVGFSTSQYELIPPTGALTEDITVYAIWKNYKYVTVIYESFDEELFKVYDGGVNGAELPVPQKPGYSFDGLYTSPNYSGNPVEYVSFYALADTYYAKLTLAEYTLTFNTGNGEVTTPDAMTYYYGDTTALPDLTRTGYNFLGWSLESDGTGNVLYNIPADLYGDYTLYAVWEAESYVVELKGNGGTVANAEEFVSFGSSYTLTPPTREGYTFLGWFDGTGTDATQYTNARGASLANWSATEGMTLYAHWQITTYTVRLNLGGGTLSGTKQWSYEYGSVLEFPKGFPTKSGLMFDGWYNEGFTKEYTGAVLVTENITLYAKWVESKAISNAEGLKKIAENPAGTYHLTADINLLGEIWTPIAEFTGTLNGNGHKIYNFTISSAYAGTTRQYGLFAKNSGTIRALTLDDFVVNATEGAGYIDVGTIAGWNAGSIINCTVQNATIKGTFTATCNNGGNAVYEYCIGGIAGSSDNGRIVGSTAAVTVNARLTLYARQTYFWSSDGYTTSGRLYIGGITGETTGSTEISYCHYEGSITANLPIENGPDKLEKYNVVGNLGVGGIMPSNAGVCHGNTANVTISAATAINCRTGSGRSAFTDLHGGGICSVNSGTVSACNATGSITTSGSVLRVGGVSAYNTTGGKLENCYTTATVVAQNGNDTYIGGLVGLNKATVRNCYAAGTVNAVGGYVGGFVGCNDTNGNITASFAASAVSNSSATNTRAFSGTNLGSIRTCYFAGDAAFTIGGSATASGAADATKKDTAAELYQKDFLMNTLYWSDLDWKMSGTARPTLFYEK